MRRTRWILVSLALAGLLLSSCQKLAETPSTRVNPAKLEAVKGTGLNRLTLTEKAVGRLGIETTSVRKTAAGATAARTVVPFASVIYDKDGKTWVYTSPASPVFVRHGITVDYIEGELAYLNAGPPVGTAIVTVGAAELFGVELGVGK